MAVGFHAGFVHSDAVSRRLSFADHNDERGQRYFVIDRAEASPEEAVPDLANVYLELDDQCRGGYGGIERVVLRRDSLAVHLGPRWAVGDDEIRITFTVGQPEFEELKAVLRLILRGYEDRLESPAEPRRCT
jgi:hypothetical protein